MLTGSVFDSEYCNNEENWFNTKYNIHFIFNALGGKEWVLGNQRQHVLGVNLKLSLRGGERYTPVDKEKTMDRRTLVKYEDRIYEEQLPPKFFADFTINYRLNRKSTVHEFALKVLNITATSEYYRHIPDYDSFTIKLDEARIVLPNLSYKYEF